MWQSLSRSFPTGGFRIPIVSVFISLLGILPWTGLAGQAPTVEVRPSTVTIPVGGSQSLAVLIGGRPATGARDAFLWTSSSPEVATVDATGEVKGVAVGQAEISLRWGEYALKVPVRVLAPGGITGVEVRPSSFAIQVGGDSKAEAFAEDLDGRTSKNEDVEWSSLNPAVATVDASGRIRGLRAGQTTIHARLSGLDATATVTVTDVTASPRDGMTSPAGAFAIGLFVPSAGEFAVGNTGRGMMVLLGVGGAVAWGLRPFTQISCKEPTVGGECPSGQIASEYTTKDNLETGLAIAVGLTLLGAIDAAISAGRKRRTGSSGGGLSPIPKPEGLDLILATQGNRFDLGLSLKTGGR